jgi:hypothetical protein
MELRMSLNGSASSLPGRARTTTSRSSASTSFVLGEYVTVTEHDGIAWPFKVAALRSV